MFIYFILLIFLRFQNEVLQESRMMIPDCSRRLEAASTDLAQILVSASNALVWKNPTAFHWFYL